MTFYISKSYIWILKAFKYIFTSPTSATKMDEKDDGQGEQKRFRREGCRTRSHVAALLGMKSVRPRAIAYIAVQLQFVLSNCGSWNLIDGEFNYQDFYYNIISYFENVETPEEIKKISDLLLWWNRMVFGRTNMSVYRPQDTQKMSVAKLLSWHGRM
ncbi:hypothetical protein EV363DRAFT_1291948 [Boletus edulis]|nr:hypothetical protein EV363DRAFT_1291948 [Boletus edulis]